MRVRGVGWICGWVLGLASAGMAAPIHSPAPESAVAPVSKHAPQAPSASAEALTDVYAGADRPELLRVVARHWAVEHPKEKILRVFLPFATWQELRVMVPQNGQRVCREGERLDARVAVAAGPRHWRVYRVNLLRFVGEPAGVSEAGSDIIERP